MHIIIIWLYFQGCFIGTGTFIWLPQRQWYNYGEYGSTAYIIRRMYCRCLWWRHYMAIFLALLNVCAGNSVSAGFPTEGPVMRNFDVSLYLGLTTVEPRVPVAGYLRRHGVHMMPLWCLNTCQSICNRILQKHGPFSPQHSLKAHVFVNPQIYLISNLHFIPLQNGRFTSIFHSKENAVAHA